MAKRFEETLNVLLHYAEKVGAFRGIAEDFKTLVEESEQNEQLREQVEKQNKAIAELTALLVAPTVEGGK